METQPVRTAKPKVLYEGRDISADLLPHLTSFAYTDQAHGQADEIEITIEDREHKWQGAWLPEKGATLQAWIVCSNWLGKSAKAIELPCGTYSIDKVSLDGPPDTVRVTAVSALVTRSLRREKKTRTWEHATLKQIATDIAQDHGLELYWDGFDITFLRQDQREESDFRFLVRLVRQYGLNVKIADEKLIVFEGKKFDGLPPSASISRGDDWINRYGFDTTADNVYRSCEVKYWDPDRKETLTHTYTPDNAPNVGHTLKINRRVESRATAVRRAQAELRRRNKREVEAAFRLTGDPALVAGITISVSGFGHFDGTYFVEEARHSVTGGQGYETGIKARKVLGY